MGYNIFNAEKVIRKIKKKQETINKRSDKMKTNPKSISVGWTDASGDYPEQRKEADQDFLKNPNTSNKSKRVYRESLKKKVKDVAYAHEYGLGNLDEKGFIRKTIAENQKKWKDLSDKLFNNQAKSGLTDQQIFEIVGKQAKEDLRSEIFSIDLVDTHRLVDSIIISYHRNRRK